MFIHGKHVFDDVHSYLMLFITVTPERAIAFHQMDCSERNKCVAFSFVPLCPLHNRSRQNTELKWLYDCSARIRSGSHVDAHLCIFLVFPGLPAKWGSCYRAGLSTSANNEQHCSTCALCLYITSHDVRRRLLNASVVGSRKKGKCYTIISLDSAHITKPQHKYTASIETARKMKKKKERSDDDSSRANTSIRSIRARTYNNNNTRRRKPSTQLRIVSIFTAHNTQIKTLNEVKWKVHVWR